MSSASVKEYITYTCNKPELQYISARVCMHTHIIRGLINKNWFIDMLEHNIREELT